MNKILSNIKNLPTKKFIDKFEKIINSKLVSVEVNPMSDHLYRLYFVFDKPSGIEIKNLNKLFRLLNSKDLKIFQAGGYNEYTKFGIETLKVPIELFRKIYKVNEPDYHNT
jgi:hypothetical protein